MCGWHLNGNLASMPAHSISLARPAVENGRLGTQPWRSCSKDESGRTSVRPPGEIKPCDALNEPYVPFDFFELLFLLFFFVAMTLLLSF
jgi:hypothetical protein